MQKKTQAQEPEVAAAPEKAAKKKSNPKKAPAATAEPADANLLAELQAASNAEVNPVAEETQAEKIVSTAICIVIPYLASKAKGNELLYAVRAWERSIPGVRIVIVGDLPSWAGKELGHVPHKPQSSNPQVDVAHKMIAAIASDLVPNVFVWTNDDIYTLCPVELADIITLKSHGLLANRGKANGVYQENTKRTIDALIKHNIVNPLDFATHTPVMMEKGGLAEVMKFFGCEKEGHLVYTLYANFWFRNHRPIITYNDGRGSIVASVYRSNPDSTILQEVLATRKWVNNNDAGWTALEPKLRGLFPDKCRFEK